MTKSQAKSIFLAAFICLFLSAGLLSAAALVMSVHNADPTRDKCQSKVWFAKGWWWAWLPYGDAGGRMWRRTGEEQWLPEEHLDLTLQLLPGRADVWANDSVVVAATVEDSTMSMLMLRWSNVDSRYEPVSIPLVWTEHKPVATITLARQSDGAFWVTYPVDSSGIRQVVVRKALPDLRWPIGGRIILDPEISSGDICTITTQDNAVCVVWTDEKDQSFYMSSHSAGQPDSAWSAPETVLKGNKDPKDDLSLCRPSGNEGPRLIIATKNGVQSKGKPVLGLLVLDHNSQWHKTPFATLSETEEPANPVIAWIYNRPVALYTLYGPQVQGFTANRIMIQQFTPDGLAAQGEPIEVVNRIIGVDYPTTARTPQPNAPCIFLTSDNQGDVIEAVVEMGPKKTN